LFAVFFILLTSTVSWVSGVLTLRKAWRVIGALDLVLSWIIAAVIIIQGAAVEVLLAILIASAALLGLVTYLTQTYEGEMANE
jgi:spore maturation protein SpmB